MVHVYYHYNNGYSRYGARCKHFATRRDADRWVFFVGCKYPTFQLDEIFDDTKERAMPRPLIRI